MADVDENKSPAKQPVGPLPKEEAGPTPATKNQVKLVEKLVSEDKKPEPPKGWKEDKKAASEYLDKHAPKQPATEKQVAFIDKFVAAGRDKPDPGVAEDKKAASEYISQQLKIGPLPKEDAGPAPATKNQVKLVEKLVAEDKKPEPPKGWKEDKKATSEYLDKHAPKQPATEKQMAFIEKLVKKKGTEKPGPGIEKDKYAAEDAARDLNRQRRCRFLPGQFKAKR